MERIYLRGMGLVPWHAEEVEGQDRAALAISLAGARWPEHPGWLLWQTAQNGLGYLSKPCWGRGLLCSFSECTPLPEAACGREDMALIKIRARLVGPSVQTRPRGDIVHCTAGATCTSWWPLGAGSSGSQSCQFNQTETSAAPAIASLPPILFSPLQPGQPLEAFQIKQDKPLGNVLQETTLHRTDVCRCEMSSDKSLAMIQWAAPNACECSQPGLLDVHRQGLHRPKGKYKGI